MLHFPSCAVASICALWRPGTKATINGHHKKGGRNHPQSRNCQFGGLPNLPKTTINLGRTIWWFSNSWNIQNPCQGCWNKWTNSRINRHLSWFSASASPIPCSRWKMHGSSEWCHLYWRICPTSTPGEDDHRIPQAVEAIASSTVGHWRD